MTDRQAKPLQCNDNGLDQRFFNRQAAALYQALASIIPGREISSRNR